MELPFTRRLMVLAGLGHHSAGAAHIVSGFNWSRSATSSASSPGVAARTGRTGMATKSVGLKELTVFSPAWTTCTQIFISQGQTIDSLGHQLLHRVLDQIRIPIISETSGKLLEDRDALLDLPQQ